jgi:hypothetical protein
LNKGLLLAVFGCVIVIALLLFCCVEVVSRHDLTQTTILLTEQRIRLFWEKTGKLPPSLDNLPLLTDRDNETKDGWGQRLEYKVDGSKVTLWSEGKSGTVSERERGVTNTFDVTKPLGATP